MTREAVCTEMHSSKKPPRTWLCMTPWAAQQFCRAQVKDRTERGNRW